MVMDSMASSQGSVPKWLIYIIKTPARPRMSNTSKKKLALVGNVSVHHLNMRSDSETE